MIALVIKTKAVIKFAAHCLNHVGLQIKMFAACAGKTILGLIAGPQGIVEVLPKYKPTLLTIQPTALNAPMVVCSQIETKFAVKIPRAEIGVLFEIIVVVIVQRKIARHTLKSSFIA